MANPLKTIIWKELRENLKWAALALLGLTLAETYALFQGRDQMRSYNDNVTLCGQAFLLVGLAGCALIGAGLGALQILPELNRDRWAALLHRPIPRSTIFFGKVISGLLLYLLATAGPLLVSLIYVATPGQFPAPFIPGMALPAASNVAFGGVFYSLALLVSLTRGRWYGRRAILALSVVPFFLLHLSTRWIFLPPLGMSLILLAAAGGVMLGNGSENHRFKMARFSFVIVLLVGVESGLGLLSLALGLIPGAGSHMPPDFRFTNFVLAADGKVFINSVGTDFSLRTLTNVDGTPVTDERYLGNDSEAALQVLSFLFWDPKSNGTNSARAATRTPRSLENYLQIAYGEVTEGAEYWYYLVGKDYFVGYDKLNHRRIGICDRNGFHSVESTPAPFPTPLQTQQFSSSLPHLYWAGRQLYAIDFGDRALTPLFTAPDGEIYGATGLMVGRQTVYFVIALEKELRILDLHGAPVVTIPYSHDVDIWNNVNVGTIPAADRIFVQYSPDYRLRSQPGEAPRPTYFEETDLQGNLVHSYSAVVDRGVQMLPGWSQYFAMSAIPPVLAPLLAIPISDSSGQSHPLWNDAVDSSGSQSLFTIVAAIFGLGLVLGASAYLWARRVGFSERQARRWALFVFFFGLPGLLTFRLTAAWPTRLTCPRCFRKRPIQAQECPSCHQAWPPPARNGTEILAAL